MARTGQDGVVGVNVAFRVINAYSGGHVAVYTEVRQITLVAMDKVRRPGHATCDHVRVGVSC